jgi:hypothetical protein
MLRDEYKLFLSNLEVVCSDRRQMMMRAETADSWSLLTILYAAHGALCRHDGQEEAGSVGSLPHLWRQTWGKMRAKYGSPTHRATSRSAIGLGEVKGDQAKIGSATAEPKTSSVL